MRCRHQLQSPSLAHVQLAAEEEEEVVVEEDENAGALGQIDPGDGLNLEDEEVAELIAELAEYAG